MVTWLWLPQARIQGKRTYLYTFILGIKYVDHKDNNSLNNTRSNLRPYTSGQNAMNKHKQKGCTSKYKGVCWSTQHKKWKAYITFNHERKYLGMFETELEAAKIYDEAAVEYFKDFARLNF